MAPLALWKEPKGPSPWPLCGGPATSSRRPEDLGSAAMGRGRIVMGLLFFPRGGSAYVVRYLSPALARAGWSVSLAVGSLGVQGEETYAPTFFDGLDVHFLDSTDAVRAF